MDRFYKIALIIAFVILIICLIGIGILMQYQNAGMKFPVHPNICPDLWKVTADNKGCQIPDLKTNVGNLSLNGVSDMSYNFTNNNICTNYKWAKQNDINWDGVSNYTGC